MLRFRVLASTLPLLALALVARGELMAGPRPCIAIGDEAVQITASRWQAQLQVGFTDDPARADVRVQIVDSPDSADFAIVDSAGDEEPGSCGLAPRTRLVAITEHPLAADPVIHLTRDGGADYRIFVRSSSFTEREAAALLIGASERPIPITTASIGSRS